MHTDEDGPSTKTAPCDTTEPGSIPDDLAEVVDIVVLAPCGDVAIHDEWSTVGSVAIAQDHAIEVMPRRGIDKFQRRLLFSVAAQVWLFGLDALGGWRYRSDVGYVAGVEVRRGDRGRAFRCAAATSSRCSSDSAVPRTASESSDPSDR